MPKGTPGPAVVKARKAAIRKLADEGFVSIDSAAKLGVSRGRLYRMASSATIGVKKVGKSIFVKRSQVVVAAAAPGKTKGRPRKAVTYTGAQLLKSAVLRHGSLLRNKQPARKKGRAS